MDGKLKKTQDMNGLQDGQRYATLASLNYWQGSDFSRAERGARQWPDRHRPQKDTKAGTFHITNIIKKKHYSK